MDIEEANKFINSLVKNLQVLCHGHVNFNNSIQVIGHLYLNVDSQTNIDYIVNEKVCKNDNSSTMFVSNSYHSEPKIKKKAKDSNSNDNSSESNDHRREPQEPKKHQKPPQRSAERDADFQSSFHSHRSPHQDPQIHQQVYKRPSQDILSPALRLENSAKKRMRMSEKSSESPMLNISNIKSEPQDVDKEDESDWSYYDQNQSSQGSIDELSNEYLSGIRDKKLSVYPVSVHPNDNNIPFNVPQLSASSSSLHTTSDGDSGGTAFQVQPESLNVSESFNERFFPCIFCGKIFRHQPSLSRHVSAKHRAYRSTCPKCGQIFSNTKAMADHHSTCNGPGSNDDDVPLIKSYPFTPVTYL